MTAPIQGQNPIPDLIGAGAQELLANAARLGLMWKMSMATVSTLDPLTVTMDGDTASIGVVSMVGSTFKVGARVYVIFVPPSGNFIVGQVEGNEPYRDQIITTEATAAVTFTNIPTNLRSVQIRANARINAAGAVALYLQINSDTSASSYYSHVYGATGTAMITPVVNNGSIAGLDVGVVAGNVNPGEYGSTVVTLTGWNQPDPSYLPEVSQSTAVVSGLGFFSRAGGGVYTGAGPYLSITLLPSSSSFETACQFDLIGDPV